MKRHAYLIIAHHHFDMLQNLIRTLDSENADFYIHINTSVKDIDLTAICETAKKSRVHAYQKYRITWGADTQIHCELFLMEQAAKGNYDYYHLLSGVDIPLRTGAQIEAFFEAQEKSFLEVKQEKDLSGTLERVRYYYPFQRLIGRQKAGRGALYALLDQLSYEYIKLQKLLKIDRTKNAPFAYCRGGNWFSVRHEIIAYALKNRRTILRYFGQSVTADELFLQSVVMSSPLADTVVRDNLRLVDWQRTEHGGCSPHTFTMADWDMLMGSDRLFARKFDPAIDREIVDAMYARVLKNSN